MASIRRGKKAARKEYRGGRINARERRAVWRYLAYHERLRVERHNRGKLAMSAIVAVLGALQLAAINARPRILSVSQEDYNKLRAMAIVESVINTAQAMVNVWNPHAIQVRCYEPELPPIEDAFTDLPRGAPVISHFAALKLMVTPPPNFDFPKYLIN